MLAGSLDNPRTGARRLPIALALIAALVLCLLPTTALAKGSHGHGKKSDFVRVMTRNIYLGADLGPGLAATTPEEFFTANGGILRQVTRTNFPLRAKALAAEILRQRPDLVGMQEVALWRTATPASLTPVFEGPSATTVRYDFLQLLLNQLNKHKQLYRAVVVQPEFDFEAPANENGRPNDGPPGLLANAELNGRLTMRDVILARNGTTTTADPRAGHFENLLSVTVSGIAIDVTRGWTAVDAKVRKSRWFHFVNTHLEAFDDETQVPSIRAQQAMELVAPATVGSPAGPARSSLPVILVGDLNSDRDTEVQPGDAQAYNVMRGAGFVNRDTSNPLSCCLTDPNLVGGSLADFNHKVDQIMTSSPSLVQLKRSVVVGLGKVNGLFPSDHAGIASWLRLQR
jgi:endonuclease/exonuclease/phosphatase family metal-dependent hydrolase